VTTPDANAERDLREQQSLLLDAAPVQMWIVADSGTYGRVNRRHADFVGRRPEELENRPLRELFPPEFAAAREAAHRQVLATGRATVTREWWTDAAGHERLLEITRTPAPSGGCVVCTAIDLTDRDAPGEADFRACFEAIGDILVISDLDGRLLYANTAASTILGFEPAELCGRHILDLHPELVRTEAAAILADMAAGLRDACPLPLQAKSGGLVPVETRIWHGRWNGAPCIFGLCKNLSKEQEALQKFDRFFRLSPAPMAVSRTDDRTFTDVNDAFLAVTGYTAAEVLGKSTVELGLFVDPDAHGQVTEQLRETGSIRDFELQLRTRDGSIRDGLFSGELIQSQGVTFFVTVMRDITEQKATIRDLRQALAEIRTLQGILPICANCKKIRDDSGYWTQVEHYVTEHTGAQFTHGMCPDCVRLLYPGLRTRP
jgi:PAS domain S-box-containing protein